MDDDDISMHIFINSVTIDITYSKAKHKYINYTHVNVFPVRNLLLRAKQATHTIEADNIEIGKVFSNGRIFTVRRRATPKLPGFRELKQRTMVDISN
ncbi:hypothetical protein Pyn_25545 [Prunus yedoensis var. nudiflora]|uniref:Uncharacterized protein n=1 Tax=Prunus yedoensis var. nudiflora TaxID=2094558 RepID=A0A315AA64_PRUYE|nr:hypothetical protein Pyn_25545 [Prunus yedoensis var. nudiflora]